VTINARKSFPLYFLSLVGGFPERVYTYRAAALWQPTGYS
jgi:hypothetical protein